MSFFKLLKNFCATSSVKGVPRIVRSQSHCLRMLWVVAVLFGASVATTQLYKLISNYLSYSTVLSVQETEEIPPFPDITICNLNYPTSRHYGIEFSMDEFVQRMYDYIEKHPEHEHIKYTLESREGYFQNFDQVRFEEVDILERSFVVACSWAVELTCPQDSIYHVFSPEYHSCYTFRANMSVDLGRDYYVDGLAAIIFMNDFNEVSFPNFYLDHRISQANGMKIIIHPQNTLPNVAIGGVNIPAGYETSITLYPSKRNRLTPPHGNCVKQEYLIPGLPYQYTRDSCTSMCHQSITINECQCLYVYHFTTVEQRRKYPFCGKLEKNVSKTIERIICLASIPYDQYPPDVCECLPACHEYHYDFRIHQVPWPHESYQLAAVNAYVNGKPWEHNFKVYKEIAEIMERNKTEAFQRLRKTNLFRRNFLQLNAYFHNTELKENTDEPSLTVERLLANLGGALNLWIGISFITLVEVCELFYHIFNFIFRGKGRTRDDNKKAAVECEQSLTSPPTETQECSL